MTQRILYKCDAPNCDREIDEESELRVLERTAFERGAVNVERRHACSAACEGSLLRLIAFDVLRGSAESKTLRELFARKNLSERWVTDHGETILPPQMRDDLGVEEGGVVWFTKVAGRWSAYKDGETVCEPPVHAEACGTEYRGCAPGCPKDRAEQAVYQAKKNADEAAGRGWYVLPGKRGFDGAGWFETRGAAVEGLERDVLGPFSTMHEARQARESVYPVLAPSALSDLLRLAGRHVPTAVVKTWSVANQCEAEAWAAFTLSDAQLKVRRAPPEPAWVREGAVARLHPWEANPPPTYEEACERWWASREREKATPIVKLRTNSVYGDTDPSQRRNFAFENAKSTREMVDEAAGQISSADNQDEPAPRTDDPRNRFPVCGSMEAFCEDCACPLTPTPTSPETCGGSAGSCPAAPQKASTIPSVVRVSWKTEDGTYSCDVDVAKGATFYMAGKMITVDPLPVRPAAEFHQITPTDPDRETAPTGERPPPSAIERTAGIRYSETTPEERAAVDRIKSAYYDLSRREKDGSHTDVITDLTVAIVAEMRRVAQEAEKNLNSVAKALDDADAPADPSLFERVQWLTRRTIQADRVHALLDEAGFASDTSLPGRVHDALTELLDGAGVAGQRPLKERVADLRDQVTTRQRAAERQSENVWEVHREVKAERDALREQKRENDATIERLQIELCRQRDDLLAELNEVRDDRERWFAAVQAADRTSKEIRAKYDAALATIDETTALLKLARKETGAPPGPNTAEAVRSLRLERDTLRGENMRLAEDLTQLRNYHERVVTERDILIKDLCKLRDLIKLGEPIPVVLHCPACGIQHVDAPDPEKGWTDPPHRSHRCASCSCIWRAADVPTRGVTAPTTRGAGDTWPDPRGDGPGWYAAPGKIGWFERRVRAHARLASTEVQGPFTEGREARLAAGEKHCETDEFAVQRYLRETLYCAVLLDQIREWPHDVRVNAATWGAYTRHLAGIGQVQFVHEVCPKPPAPVEISAWKGEEPC